MGRAQPPTVSIETTVASVPEAGTNNGFFTVRRIGATTAPLRVEYSIAGTATNGQDYARLPGSLVIPAGQSSATITVAPFDNVREEPARTVVLSLADSTRPFTLVVLPDTQYYVSAQYGGRPELFRRQTEWIVEEKDRRNIAFMLHEGDCTDLNSVSEWQNFKAGINLLDGVVPYAIAVGNHDGLNDAAGDTSLFNSYFPVTNHQGRATFGGLFESNKMDNCYHFVTAGGVNWLVLTYEFGPRDAVLDWANQVVTNHPNHRVLLVSHAHVYTDNTLHGSLPAHYWTPTSYGRTNNGVEVWEKFIRKHANIAFVFNGHVLNHGSGRVVGTGDHGNKVYQMLANYQMLPNGGNSYLRILEFDPARDRVSVQSYSPELNFFLRWSEHEFAYEHLGIFNTNAAYAISSSAAAATVTIINDDFDTSAPAIARVRATGLPPEILVTFDEPVERVSAVNLAHYSVTPGVQLAGASLGSDLRTVTLAVNTLLATGVTYTLTVNGVRDRAAASNAITAGLSRSFTWLPLLLAEDFEDSSLDGWTVVDEGTRDAPSNWGARRGRVEQSSGIFGPTIYSVDQRQGTFAFWNHPTAADWGDYTLQVTFNTSDDDGLGVLFHFENPANYYKLELDYQRGFHKLFKKVAGLETQLAYEPGGYPQSQAAQLRVAILGNQITAWLNGGLLFGGPVSDGSLPRGTVALYAWGCEGVSFDDVLVAPAGNALPGAGSPTNAPGVGPPAVVSVFSFDSDWRFWPFEDLPGPDWNQPTHDDTGWPGPNRSIFANDADLLPDPINTSLSLGPVTFYFRQRFNYTHSPLGACLRLRQLVDDGAVYYLNGVEILRVGMPAGPITYDTLAARDVDNANYEGPFDLPVTNLIAGPNVLAVEIHQYDLFSEDVAFGVELEAVIPALIPAPFSLARLLANGDLQLVLPGVAGRTYLIEASPDLVHWERIVTRVNFFGTALMFNLGAPEASQRFYRAWLAPLSCSER